MNSSLSAPLPPPIFEDPNPGILRFCLHAFYGAAWTIGLLLSSVWWVSRSFYDAGFREMVLGRLGFGLPKPPLPGERQRVLIHGVSVGEVKAAQFLVQVFEKERPDLEVVISTVTNTGFKIGSEIYPGRKIVRLPVEPALIVKRFLRQVRPVAVILIELEIWPNFLRAANELGIPVAVVNGRITQSSYDSYRHFRNLLPQFNRISLYCVQMAEYGKRFALLSGGEERILVTGNVKWDSLGAGRVDPGDELRELLGGAPDQIVVTAGSTHADEELQFVKAWRDSFSETRLILVPRHPPRAAEVLSDLASVGIRGQRLRDLRAGETPDPKRPVIVDTIGELERVYGLSDLVFIGGTLIPHGGQNMLEPASQGIPVIYGPHIENFSVEAGLLEEVGAARRLTGAEQIGPCVRNLVGDPDLRKLMAAAGLGVVKRETGATQRTFAALKERCLPPA
ncbi:MAG: 3-deoxy-D-manno-octulosonic-acid transferase [Planctomycetota bacterium]|jgi:3-deoxy-D-manno-octulosonic-acid transferase